MIFFTSDTHFGHSKILEYTDRPFEDIDEHDAELIKNWNQRVQKNDEVYHLGDVSLSNLRHHENIMRLLNGRIYLVRGNHDKALSRPKYASRFEWVRDYHVLKHEGYRIALFHYPIEIWDKAHRGSFHLHGHSHNGAPVVPRRMDVGIDNPACQLRPISIDEVTVALQPQTYIPKDHHK